MCNQGEMERNSKVSTIHEMQFWVFYFLKQKICAQRFGRINLERISIEEIILLQSVRHTFPIIPRHKITETKEKATFRNSKERIPSLVHLNYAHELFFCL